MGSTDKPGHRRLCRAAFAVLLTVAAGCSDSVSELVRFPNADGTVEAVSAIRNTGATVDTPSEVYVVAKGGRVSGEPVFRADKVDGLSITWHDGITIVIHAKAARVFLHRDKMTIDGPSGSRAISVHLDVSRVIQ